MSHQAHSALVPSFYNVITDDQLEKGFAILEATLREISWIWDFFAQGFMILRAIQQEDFFNRHMSERGLSNDPVSRLIL